MSKTNPKGHYLALSPSRRFLLILAGHARKVPSVLVVRRTNIRPLVEARAALPERPSWAAVFMKAYAAISARHPEFRRAFFSFPWPRLYEHPMNICSLAIEREYQGELGVFFTLIRQPENRTLPDLTACIRHYKTTPVDQVGFYRQAIRFSRLPTWLTWPMVWSTLNLMGYKRAKRLGTFSLSAYGGLGAESFHAVSPLTTTLSYGVIDDEGDVAIKLIYDHRVLDGAFVARALTEMDEVLHTSILDELRALAPTTRNAALSAAPSPLLHSPGATASSANPCSASPNLSPSRPGATASSANPCYTPDRFRLDQPIADPIEPRPGHRTFNDNPHLAGT